MIRQWVNRIDAFCNGSSLAHAAGPVRKRPIYARGVRSGAEVRLFVRPGLLFAALVSVGIVLSEETGIGTLAQHATGWWAANVSLAPLSVIVIQFSMMGAIGVFDLSSHRYPHRSAMPCCRRFCPAHRQFWAAAGPRASPS